MGLDFVELVMRTEEVFGIAFEDAELVPAVTVGAFYCIVCEKLGVTPLLEPEQAAGRLQGVLKMLNLEVIVWTPEDVWATLVWVVVDQLQVQQAEVRYSTRWVDDLGAD